MSLRGLFLGLNRVPPPPAPAHARWLGSSVVYWTMDEASGNRAALVGGLTLTDNNTVGSMAGVLSNAAVFVSASNEYLEYADNAALNIGGGDFTIRAWVYVSGAAANGYIGIIGKDHYLVDREWLLQYRAGGINRFDFYLFTAANGVAGTVSSSAGLGTDVYYHVVITRSGNDLALYLDAGAPTTGTVSGTPVNSTPVTFRVGSDNLGSASALDGRIDEVAIVKGLAWDAAQVTYDYNAGAGRRYPD